MKSRSAVRALSLILLGVGSAACAARAAKPAEARVTDVRSGEMRVPSTARSDVVEIIHGVAVADPYRWLEDGSATAVQQWVAQQDRHARGHLERLPDRSRIEQRLWQLNDVDSMSPPVQRGTRSFFVRRAARQEKAVHYWREADGEPRVLLDPNALSSDGSVSVRSLKVSYDGRFATYELSQNNADLSVLKVLRVDDGTTLEADSIPGVRYSHVAWLPQSDGFYYTRLPLDEHIAPSQRGAHAKVYLHELGRDYHDDELVFENPGDPKLLLGVDLSRDGRFLFVYLVHGWKRTDVYVRDSQRDQRLRPLFVGTEARFYVTAYQGRLYVYTNHEAPHWRMMRIDALDQVGKDPRNPYAWRELVPEDANAVLKDYGIIGGHLSLTYEARATTQIRLATLDGQFVRTVESPGIGNVEGLFGEPDGDTAYYTFESFLEPETILRTSVRRGGVETFFAPTIAAQPKAHHVEQVTYRSIDGTEVSMFLITPERFERDGKAPFLLMGYGGMNVSVTPHFDSSLYVWLEAGGGIALPNLRGGGEYGKAWHDAGRLKNKQNVFDDFIAAAEYLIREKYTSTPKLAIGGGSNGGLLVGAAMTQRPDLFGAALPAVGVMDMLRFHKFTIGWAWKSDYGSSETKEGFDVLYKYSPLHNLKPGTAYPATMVTTADHDDRVVPAHSFKFAAALQAAHKGPNPVLIRIETKAGHGAGKPTSKQIEEAADKWAFLTATLGVTVKPMASN